MGTVMARNSVTTTGRADGPAVVLAHGFGCDQNMWRRVVGALGNQYLLVLFDHVGAGRSDLSCYDRNRYTTLDGYARDVVEICDELRLTDVTLVGHSVSAMIGAAAAVLRPDLFARLVMVCPSPRFIDGADGDGYVGGFSERDIADLLQSMDDDHAGWAGGLAPMVVGLDQPPALHEELTASFCRTRPDIAHDFARLTFAGDARDLLPEVCTPTLVLQCSDDMLAPVAVGEYVHARLRDSTYVLLAATGHCPQISAPGATTAAILRFLADV